MPTVRQMVSMVRSPSKLLSSDNIVSDRAIADELKEQSKVLIKRETDRRKLFASDNIFTEIPCLKLIEVSLAECCNYKSECTIARSEEKLPKLGGNQYGMLIQGVYSVDNMVEFSFADPERYANLLRMYPKKKDKLKFFWKRNGYLYVTDPNVELVKINAYFEEDVPSKFFTCTQEEEVCPVNPLDLEFKCPGYLGASVLKLTREEILRLYFGVAQDRQEDDAETSK